MLLNVSQKILWVAIFVFFFVFLLSKGLSLVPGYAIDDWSLISRNSDPSFFLSNGRYTQALFEALISNMNIDVVSSSWTFTLLYFLTGSWAVFQIILYLVPEKEINNWILFSAFIFISHPYLTEYSSFRQSSFGLFICWLLIGLLFLILRTDNSFSTNNLKSNKIITFSVALFLLILLLGMNQLFLLFVVSVIATRGFMAYLYPQNYVERSTRNQLFFELAAVLFSVVFYLILATGLQAYFNINSAPRMSFLNLGEVSNRLYQIKELLENLFILDEPVLATLPKIVLLTVITVIFFVAIKRKIQTGIFLILFFVFLCLLSISIIAISGVWWPAPRTLIPFPFVVFLFFVSCVGLLTSKIKKLLSSLLIIVTIMFSAQSSQILSDQLRLNRWDQHTASQISNTLRDFEINDSTVIYLVGFSWSYPTGIKTVQNDLNISALFVDYAVSSVFRESTGQNLTIRAIPTSEYCNPDMKWPSKESVIQISDEIFICR